MGVPSARRSCLTPGDCEPPLRDRPRRNCEDFESGIGNILKSSGRSYFVRSPCWPSSTPLLLRDKEDSAVQPTWDLQLEAEQQRLRRMAGEVPVDDFLKEANATLKQWESKPDEVYGRLAETIGDVLNSAPYSGDKSAQAATWLLAAETIRRKARAISVPTLIRLLYQLASEPVSDRSDWPAVRSERAQWWLDTWNRLDQAMDRDFNPDHVPELTAGPTAAAKAEYYRQQFQFRQAEPLFKRTASAYLAHLYSLTPERPEELGHLLTTHLSESTRNAYFPPGGKPS